MYTGYKAIQLKRGVAVVNRRGGGSYVVVTSSKTVDWWDYLYRNITTITEFGMIHCSAQTVTQLATGILTHDSDTIADAITSMFDECPDAIADAKHRDLAVLSVLNRLMTMGADE